MSFIKYFSNQPEASEIPDQCRNPFDNNPHMLAIFASNELQQRLKNSTQITSQLFEKECGKMFGVLVIADEEGKIGFISSFSGMLNKQWIVPGFVPPVFNIKQQHSFFALGEKQVTEITQVIQLQLNSENRLQDKQKLIQLGQQHEKELAGLKKQHKKNKAQRKIKRLAIKNEKDESPILQQLSFQSQQDKRELKQLKSDWKQKILLAEKGFNNHYENSINELISKRKTLSQRLHKQVFESYKFVNGLQQYKPLMHFFNGIPPGGTGDCAAPKLIQYALKNKFKILAMAEFWWGAPPAKGVRQHANFYPPCRGKCYPILPFMLKGIIDKAVNSTNENKEVEPDIVFEDENLLVINKPAGMLSIPGKQQDYSVLSWLKKRYPEATGALLVHRLDMATSGLLVAAKNAQVHKHLQKQFISRSIKKRYVAVLSKVLDKKNITVNLPLRVDLEDRPRQLVCYEYGKVAETHVRVISKDEKTTRVYFYPVTGRTHQLRVHAAHSQGLCAPIVGDELYGNRSERLLLHAEKICFEHPLTGETIKVKSKVPF